MKEEYSFPLDEEGKNIIRVVKVYGKGLVDITVVYYTIKEGRAVPLVTYDLSHGFAHRDIRYLPEKDRRRKKEIRVNSLEEFLKMAIDDIWRNWRRYLKEYEER